MSRFHDEVLEIANPARRMGMRNDIMWNEARAEHWVLASWSQDTPHIWTREDLRRI